MKADIYHYVNITFTYSFKTYENIFNSQIIWANKQAHTQTHNIQTTLLGKYGVARVFPKLDDILIRKELMLR